MLQDKSLDYEETWKFLDRRFEDVAGISSVLHTSTEFASGM